MINYKKFNSNIINDFYEDYYEYLQDDESDEKEVLEIMVNTQ